MEHTISLGEILSFQININHKACAKCPFEIYIFSIYCVVILRNIRLLKGVTSICEKGFSKNDFAILMR